MGMRIVLLAGLMALTSARSAGAGPTADRTACGLALEIVKRTLDGYPQVDRIVFSDEPGSSFRDLKPKDFGGARTPPKPDLVQAFVRSRDRNAVAVCPDIRALFAARHVAYGAEAVAAAKAGNLQRWTSPGPSMTIHSVMLPVISGDGREALGEQWSSCAGLCGNGVIRHFRHSARGWTEGEPVGPSWIS